MDGVLNSQSQLALLIVLLFAFNMIRGIASCAWFPWIRGLIPETIRGRYLTLESAFANAGSLLAFLLVAIYLGKSPTSGQFTVLFAFSFVMGAVSIAFIRRVPDVAPPEERTAKNSRLRGRRFLRPNRFENCSGRSCSWPLRLAAWRRSR